MATEQVHKLLEVVGRDVQLSKVWPSLNQSVALTCVLGGTLVRSDAHGIGGPYLGWRCNNQARMTHERPRSPVNSQTSRAPLSPPSSVRPTNADAAAKFTLTQSVEPTTGFS